MQFNRGWAELMFELMGFDPEANALQTKAIYEILNGRRFMLICGGVRGGKSFVTAAIIALLSQPEVTDDLAANKKKLIWLVGPDYWQPRAEFSYLHDAFEKGGLLRESSMPQNATSPWRMETVWNLEVFTKSSSNLKSLASFPPDVFAMCEANQQEYSVYLRGRERVSQKRGHVLLSGTLEEGLPWYGDLLRRWKAPNPELGWSVSIPSWSNRKEYPGGWDDPEMVNLRASMHIDYFMERFGAEPRKATNLVIPDFDYSKHVRDLKPQPDIPVRLWIDPGKNAYAVLFVQVVGKSCYVLDRIYRRGAIAQDVIRLAKDNELWPLVLKNGGSHGVIDIAGRQQHGLPSHVEIWQQDAGIRLRSNYVHEDTGRDVVRFRLSNIDPLTGEPMLLFNSHMTNNKAPDGTAEDVLAEFELWKWRQPSGNRSEPHRPIDANNHAIKALGYGLYDEFGPTTERKQRTFRRKRASWATM